MILNILALLNNSDIVAYIGVLLVFSLFLFRSVSRIHGIVFISNILMGIYGILISNWLTAAFHFILIINLAYLSRNEIPLREQLKILTVDKSSKYLSEFLEFHKNEIYHFFPDFKYSKDNDNVFCILILRNLQVAGLFIGEKSAKNTMEIKLDYAIPEFRDFKLGYFIYKKSKDFFIELGVKELISTCYHKKHESYLKKMGFQKTIIEDRVLYRIELIS